MNHKRITGFLIILILLTGILAVIVTRERPSVPEGMIQVETADGTWFLSPDKAEMREIQGYVVNGKGIKREVSGRGIALAELLGSNQIDLKEYEEVTVIANDEYRASYSPEKLQKNDDICLIRGEQGWDIVAFGDKDSRRNVTNVMRICLK